MDPLSAFSLACGIIQVVDFSTKVISQSREIYKRGSLAENDDLEYLITHLNGLQVGLQPLQLKAGRVRSQSQEERELGQLSRKCTETALQLLRELQKLKIYNTDTKWESVTKVI